MKYLQSQFDSYRAGVIPADAPAVQIGECRRAFMAGAQAHIALGTLLSDGAGVTAADIALAASVQSELDEFVQAVLRGEA